MRVQEQNMGGVKGERGEKKREVEREKNTPIADLMGATYTCGGSSKKLTP